jgi:hypothetical protein
MPAICCELKNRKKLVETSAIACMFACAACSLAARVRAWLMLATATEGRLVPTQVEGDAERPGYCRTSSVFTA